MYVRKTIDRWDVETDYGDGWCVECSEYSWKEARKTVQEYRANPCGWLRIRLVKRREKRAERTAS